MKRSSILVSAAILVIISISARADAQAPALPLVPNLQQLRPDRSVEPVVLTGASFPQWSAGPEITARRPQVVQPTALNPSDCVDQRTASDPSTDHSCSQKPDVAIYGDGLRKGVPVEHLLGYRWDASSNHFVEIPLQVDEVFTRYLSNNASGFAIYSGVDPHTTYAFDKENFRFVEDALAYPAEAYSKPYPRECDSRPRPGDVVTKTDPLPGLDDNDELVFMASDTGPKAPQAAVLPAGIVEVVEVTVVDPLDPSAQRYVYVMRSGDGGPHSAYDATNGYVRYQPDADTGMFVFSRSSYGNYGAAPQGPYCDPVTHALVTNVDGSVKIGQRRPRDTAWVRTPRYEFRYEGRWLMTEIHVSPDEGGLSASPNYGPDLIDRWKARAFQQDPSSNTPCCGYEEEDTNWGGSSITLGEKVGPVRAIRETWGADSGTNVIRRDTFYRDSVDYSVFLRVHPIPPLDGIYTQWDYNAGRMTKYYNPMKPQGVDLDGRNDEVFGNIDDPCNPRYDPAYGPIVRQIPGACSQYHQSIDIFDPTHSMVNATLQYEQVSGPWGTLVTRWTIDKVTPGAAQGIVAVPYYRDDSCFDDGTGSSPGPRVKLRSDTEIDFVPDESTGVLTSAPRRCWTPADGLPLDEKQYPGTTPDGKPWPKGDLRFYQGDIGAHGLHLLFLVESDNASLTLPLTEIDSQQWQVILPGDAGGNVGERYGRQFEKPLVAVALPRADLE
jgi:hypothetical protein